VAPVSEQEAARLGAEIGHEVVQLARVVSDVEARREERDATTTYAIALLLMNYYTGAERIFTRIAALLGGTPPAGPRWHAQVLEDMALRIEGVRPAVLQEQTAGDLQRLLRFRHAIRNLYAWTLRREDMDSLVDALRPTHDALVGDLAGFGGFLGELSGQ